MQPPRQRAAPAEPVADGPRRSAGGRPSTRRVPVVNRAARARRPRASQVRHAMPVTLPERLRRPRRSPVGLCYRCRAQPAPRRNRLTPDPLASERRITMVPWGGPPRRSPPSGREVDGRAARPPVMLEATSPTCYGRRPELRPPTRRIARL
jgi:hypothetical protein